MNPVWRLRSTTGSTRWVAIQDDRLVQTERRDLAEQWPTPDAALAALDGRPGWRAVPGRPTEPVILPEPPPPPPKPVCQLCGDDLIDFSGFHHKPPTRARCEFCGQGHRREGGVWVALDRWTGEPLNA